MAEIFPFRAYRYNTDRVEISKVLTQPYDKITPEMQERYYASSLYNLISVEKGRAHPEDTPLNNVYTRAAKSLQQWIQEGILLQDPRPGIYAYSQEYKVPEAGEPKVRHGFIALGRVEDYSSGVVFRHEQTLAAPRVDRLELLRHTRAHTGQLFMLYSDPAGTLDGLLEQNAKQPAAIEILDEYRVLHRLWLMTDSTRVQTFVRAMADQTLVIADGHHRYETALAYRNERRAAGDRISPDAPHEKVMMTFVNSYSDGLTILPTHRVIFGLPDFSFEAFRQKLAPWFEVTTEPFSATNREAGMKSFQNRLWAARQAHSIGVYAGREASHLFHLRQNIDLRRWLPELSPAQLQLDVVLLHRLILELGLGVTAGAVAGEQNIRYERAMESAIGAVDAGRAQFCCLLNPIQVEQVMSMARAGEVLPQKSTDFYPKLLSGLAIYRLDE